MIKILYTILHLSLFLFIVVFIQSQRVVHEGIQFEGKQFVCEDAKLIDSQLKCSFISMDIDGNEEE